jgi:hypothetical protein
MPAARAGGGREACHPSPIEQLTSPPPSEKAPPARPTRPTVAEVRAVGQPPGLLERSSAEHWAGRLYMRRLSPYVTRALLRTRATPNGVTWAMTASGLLAALVLTLRHSGRPR